MQTQRSVCEEIGAKIDRSTVLRALCLGWLVPAVSLMWVGFGVIGLRPASDQGVADAIDRTQTMAVMLTIFTLLIGCMWALRTWDQPESEASGQDPVEDHRWHGRRHPTGHLTAVVVALTALALAALDRNHAGPLTVVAAVAGCYGGMIIPRVLLRSPYPHLWPAAALGAAMVFRVTVGWLPAMHPTGALSPLLALEGLILAWTALAAARVIGLGPFPASADQRVEPEPDRVSQAPALPSLREPAVGR